MEVLYQLSYPGAGTTVAAFRGGKAMAGMREQRERLAGLLTVGATLTILTGLALGLLVTPLGFIAVAVGLLDFVWIALLRAGRVGPRAPGVEEEADLTENPYARED